MNSRLAMLTVGTAPVREVLPLLTEQFPEQAITQMSLLGALTRNEALAHYAAAPGEESIIVMLQNRELVEVSHAKVERALQSLVEVLDKQGFDIIVLMSTLPFHQLAARNTMLLEPYRIVPPLVSSIIGEKQVGIIISVPELLKFQARKWQLLKKMPLYAQANPVGERDEEWIAAGRALIAQGATVLLLDCLGFHQHHRDVLQKALNIPVLLANALVTSLAVELLALEETAA